MKLTLKQAETLAEMCLSAEQRQDEFEGHQRRHGKIVAADGAVQILAKYRAVKALVDAHVQYLKDQERLSELAKEQETLLARVRLYGK